jgi:hypothetical protein
MRCVQRGSSVVSERVEQTAQGYRRSSCRAGGRSFRECTHSRLNRTHYLSDVIGLVVLRRLRHKLSLRELTEMFLARAVDTLGAASRRQVE